MPLDPLFHTLWLATARVQAAEEVIQSQHCDRQHIAAFELTAGLDLRLEHLKSFVRVYHFIKLVHKRVVCFTIDLV